MKITALKNKKYKLIFLILVFTSLSSFSQDYITSKEEWDRETDSREFGAIEGMAGYSNIVWPIIKNAKCNEPTTSCFIKEVRNFIQKELSEEVRARYKAVKKIRYGFIIEKNGKIKHVTFFSQEPKNAELYKEFSRVIKKLPTIGRPRYGSNNPKKEGEEVAVKISDVLRLESH